MTTGHAAAEIRSILETDRNWSAYALADLDPSLSEHAEWLVDGDSVVLLYGGLHPPVLFAHGEPQGVKRLFDQLPAAEVQYTLQPTHRSLLGQRLEPLHETKMWRMILRPADFPGPPVLETHRLATEHLDQIGRLMAGQPDRPDAFSPSQLESGVFYGIFRGDRLVSMAGTHVVSQENDTAAVGNVFTDPNQRGRGYGRATCASVVADLLAVGIGTIVLNVAMANEAAVKVYRALGFWPFCGYYEGVGWLASPVEA
jgi:ribosomal protein S18 acetylase RimI-like enzyme